MKILVSSRTDEALKNLRDRIAQIGGYEVEGVLMVNGTRDPLRIVDYRPDVLVLQASEHIVDELQTLAERPGRERPPVVVVGDRLPQDAVRYAMRAGVRDFISDDDDHELAESLRRLRTELYADGDGDGDAIVVMNAKGGSGATFVATSLAHLSATIGGDETAIVDLDFQYASVPHYFDVKPKRGLLEALANAEDLDETAISAYAVKLESGVHVFAPIPETQVAVDFNLGDRMLQVLAALKRRYRKVVIDVPRHLDDLSSRVLLNADHILMVMQPTLLSVHDAVRLKTLIVRELEVPEDRIMTVVNRFSKNNSLELSDIKEALDDDDPMLIPNHYRLVTQTLDMGALVTEEAPTSSVTKALMELQRKVMGYRPKESRSFLAKTVMRFRG